VPQKSPACIAARAIVSIEPKSRRTSPAQNAGWETKIKDRLALKTDRRAAGMAVRLVEILFQMKEYLAEIETLTMGLRLMENKRTLSYVQVFRDEARGQKIYRKLNAGAPKNLDAEDRIPRLIALFMDPQYNHNLEFKDHRLAAEISWLEKGDQAVLEALSKATAGRPTSPKTPP
jgi:hypothetical protein